MVKGVERAYLSGKCWYLSWRDRLEGRLLGIECGRVSASKEKP